jgi:hypothetical protein
VATLLVQRGITTFEEVELFRPSLNGYTISILMKDDMDKTVEAFW